MQRDFLMHNEEIMFMLSICASFKTQSKIPVIPPINTCVVSLLLCCYFLSLLKLI